MARHGVKTPQVAVLDDKYVRATILTPSGCAYFCFPTLTWRVWENHPSSVASPILPSSIGKDTHDAGSSRDVEIRPGIYALPLDDSSRSDNFRHHLAQAGLTFYIRDKTGITAALRKPTSLPFCWRSYSSQSPSSLNRSPIMVVIAGSVGITAVLPYLRTHLVGRSYTGEVVPKLL